MAVTFESPEDYISSLPEERQRVVQKLHGTIVRRLPEGFECGITYGMISYFVPHSVYPKGYHVDPGMPLPFISLASQKNYIALYHMGIYALPNLLDWFREEYPKHSANKLDMGKSCIRFKNLDKIPYELVGELASKVTVQEWITAYEAQMK